jgi:hypothetical protein
MPGSHATISRTCKHHGAHMAHKLCMCVLQFLEEQQRWDKAGQYQALREGNEHRGCADQFAACGLLGWSSLRWCPSVATIWQLVAVSPRTRLVRGQFITAATSGLGCTVATMRLQLFQPHAPEGRSRHSTLAGVPGAIRAVLECTRPDSTTQLCSVKARHLVAPQSALCCQLQAPAATMALAMAAVMAGTVGQVLLVYMWCTEVAF